MRDFKSYFSEDYNFVFNKKTGFFARWGKTKEDNPPYSKIGPEILDIEVGTSCQGLGKSCPWCYKGNTPEGEYMSLETFKKILHKFPRSLCQAALGIGDISGNPDLFEIMDYCRNNEYNSIIPNITINGFNLKDEYAEKLVK